MMHKGISLVGEFNKKGFDNLKLHKQMRELKEQVEARFSKEKGEFFWKVLFGQVNRNN